MKISPVLALGSLTLCLGISACDDEAEPPPEVRIAATPMSVAAGDVVTVDVEVEHFELAEPDGTHGEHDHGDHDHDNLEKGGSFPVGSSLEPLAEGEHEHEEDHDHDHGSSASGDYDGPRIGHYHIYLDDLMTEPLVQGWQDSVEVTIPADTAAGSHMLMLRLHGLDHRIIEPQIVGSTMIEVE